MTTASIPNRPLGTDQRSIELILANFDAVLAVINGELDHNNLSAGAAIALSQLASGAARPAPVAASTSRAATDGQLLNCVPGITVTLTPVAGAVISVFANPSVSGASPVTVSAGGGVIYGEGTGAGGAANVLLGSPLTHLTFYCLDGTNWLVTSGKINSGWVALTLPGGIASVGGYTPAVKIEGNRAWFTGGLVNTGSLSAGVTWATLPSSVFRPASAAYLNAVAIGSGPAITLVAGPSTSALVQVGGPAANGTILTLEGASYPLS